MVIDVVTLVVFGYGFWTGYARGIITTIFNFMAYVFGIVLAFRMAPVTNQILTKALETDNPLWFLAAFLINFAVILFILRAAANGIEGMLRAFYLNPFNRILGGVVSGGFAVLIFSVLLWFADKAQIVAKADVAPTVTYDYLMAMPVQARKVVVRLTPFAKEFWSTSATWMDRLENYGVQRAERNNLYKPDPAKGDNPVDRRAEEKPRPRYNREGPAITDE